jgi:hypothetical protein
MADRKEIHPTILWTAEQLLANEMARVGERFEEEGPTAFLSVPLESMKSLIMAFHIGYQMGADKVELTVCDGSCARDDD